MDLLERAGQARSQIEDISTLCDRDLADLLAQTDRGDALAARGLLEEAVPDLVGQYRGIATTLAADLYEQWREDAGVPGAYAPLTVPDLAPEAVRAGVRSALGSVFTAAQDWTAMEERLRGSVERHVANAHRDTVELNADGDPAGTMYARHASATACGFCRVLATRSAAYLSRASAGEVVGRGTEAKKRRDGEARRGRRAGGVQVRGSRPLGSKYHDHCHCAVVTVFPGETYEPAPYVSQWLDTYREAYSSSEPGTSSTRAKAAFRLLDEGRTHS